MLKEIECPFFNHGKISFHQGLNVILGDDDAKNSIGKSTALMVIDFVHGGNSFMKDEAGVIKALGHHNYNFCFIFAGKPYFYSRSTDNPDLVYVCDQSYERGDELQLNEYCSKLKELYGLHQLENTFRNIVSPFSRIWKKGALNPDKPFSTVNEESGNAQVSRLIDMFQHSGEISDEKRILDGQADRKKVIARSMAEEIIPSINKKQYRINSKIISENAEQIQQLKEGFRGALTAYEAMFDRNLQAKKQQQDELLGVRSDVNRKIKRLEKELSGITPRITANISLVEEFFPNVNVERIEQVELFHKKIGGAVRKELNKELAEANERLLAVENDISSLENEIKEALRSKGLPDDLFRSVFELKERTDKALQENRFYDQKYDLQTAISSTKKRLEDIYTKIFLDIEGKVNCKLRGFNRVVYGPERNSSKLRVKKSNSFSFTSPDDTGTGKSYAGMIGFDRAMLSVTNLPYVIHDSVVYKNIEVDAIKQILRIFSNIKTKQIFISFDEARKFGSQIEKLLQRNKAIKLSNDDLLYNKDWRDSE